MCCQLPSFVCANLPVLSVVTITSELQADAQRVFPTASRKIVGSGRVVRVVDGYYKTITVTYGTRRVMTCQIFLLSTGVGFSLTLQDPTVRRN